MSQASQARLIFCIGLFALVAYAGAPVEMQQPSPTGIILPSATSFNLHRPRDTAAYRADSPSLTPQMEATAGNTDGRDVRQRKADTDRNQTSGQRVGELTDALSAALAERRRTAIEGQKKETSAAASDTTVRSLLRAINAEVRRKRN